MNSSADICVVGAGIAGAALAAALRGSSLRIALLEANAQTIAVASKGGDLKQGLEDFDPRVSAITPASQAFLAQLGVWESIAAQRVCGYDCMQVWDAESTGAIDFFAREVQAQHLGYIVENRLLTRGLFSAVENAAEVEIYCPARVENIELEGTPVLYLEDGQKLSCSLIVAADGALSRLRELGNFETREWDYGHHALVCTVETELPHADTAYQRFMSSGPLAFLPLASDEGHSYSSIVWSVNSDDLPGILALDDQGFLLALYRAFEGRLGSLLACSPRFAFPLRQRHAVDYVRAGLALVGDAAHTIHPLAGQGTNLGLSDVKVLAEEIRAASKAGDNIGNLAVLKRYQRQRKGDNLLMMAAMDGFKNLFAQTAMPVRLLRSIGMRMVNKAGPIKQDIMRRAMGIG